MDQGIVESVGYDGGSLPKVWVTESFLALDRKAQNQFLEVIYAYYNIADDNFGVTDDLVFRDSLIVKIDDGTVNGKRIATYDPINGIEAH